MDGGGSGGRMEASRYSTVNTLILTVSLPPTMGCSGYGVRFRMAVVAMFFRLSMTVRDAHNYLVEKKGLPPVASYLIFGGATLILGCILGFVSSF